MLEEFARLFLKAVSNDGILEDDYIEKRRQRYLEDVERGAVKKVHVDETPKNFGKKKPVRKNKMMKAIEEREGMIREQNALREALEFIENETENEIPETNRARKSGRT